MLNFSVLRTKSELLHWRKKQQAHVGFIPTMGGLHRGHEKLIQTATCRILNMGNKLGQGDPFPQLTLNMVGGGTIDLPDNLNAKYNVVLFYRGHW